MENRPSNPGHVTKDIDPDAPGVDPNEQYEPDPDGVTDQTAGDDQPELTAPTSNDVGKQTLTKADMGGRDVTKEGVPEEYLESPRHPDDPSGDGPDAVQEV